MNIQLEWSIVLDDVYIIWIKYTLKKWDWWIKHGYNNVNNLLVQKQPLDVFYWCSFTIAECYISFVLTKRSSRPEVLCKKGVPENVAKFTGKHLCQILFLNKVTGIRLATLLKRRIWDSCVLVNFAKFLRTPFLQNTSRWLLQLAQPFLTGIFTSMLSLF